MKNKNKKAIIVGVVMFALIAAALVAALLIAKKNRQSLEQLGEVRKAASLDDYIESDPGLLHKKNAEELQLKKKEIIPPVQTQIPLQKITMAPIMMVGGDVIYDVIGELPGNNFFRIESDNINKVFSVRTSDEALKYIDFLMVTAGKSSYNRARTTIWNASDYEKLNCSKVKDSQNLALPKDRPVSQAKVSGDGFEVTWIYFSPVVPSGYYKMVIQVEKNGDINIKDNPKEPFGACGGGILF